MMNVMTLLLLLLTSSFLLAEAAEAPGPQPAEAPGPQHDCPQTCGDVSIPYPFGIFAGCSMDGFQLDCITNDGVDKPYFNGTEIINISLPEGLIRMYNPIAKQCYNSSNEINIYDDVWFNNPNLSLIYPYRFSNTLNKFTNVGCGTFASLASYVNNDVSEAVGCVTTCNSEKSLTNGSCSGVGCCQTTVPEDLTSYEVDLEILVDSLPGWQFNGCSYAVLLEASWFNFSSSYVTTGELFREHNGTAPVVVDWVIGSDNCSVTIGSITSYACVDEHSECVGAANGPGYLCNCSGGYQGNPYLKGGCTDINECLDPTSYPCFGHCHNTPGSYSCRCPAGKSGNPKSGHCHPAVELIIGIIGVFVFILLLLSMCIYLGHEKRKLRLVKEKYFQQHDGRLLLEEIEAKHCLSFKIFEQKELEQATNKFDNNRILGQGGHGTVYKGFLEDEAPIAIKKSRIIDEKQKKEFGREMIILSRINHKNIVKLLGCCLEVEIPMLVYEFISNGDLFHLIHQQNNTTPVSLPTRLRIAYESAEALAYLHSSASPPILHGDVKSSNILLDDSYTAKVSDFGASILAPNAESQFVTLVQGTCGYLDPEYIRTCQLTDKSDVYSFGVVLAELFTGRMALTFDGSEEKSLASFFVSAMNEGRLVEIMDSQVKAEGEEGLIQKIGELVSCCLRILGEERPTMKEVADELSKLIKFREHTWLLYNAEETESLLSKTSNSHGAGTSFSIEMRALQNTESGR